MRIAVYPGSFDPFTNGHMDILHRAAGLFDKIIVAILVNPAKTCLFSPEERVEMINEVIDGHPNISATHFNGLLVEFCQNNSACAIIRGLRAVTDYEYEMQMFAINHNLTPEIETVFLMSTPAYSFLSSSIAKELAKFHGSVKNLVPPNVNEALIKKFI